MFDSLWLCNEGTISEAKKFATENRFDCIRLRKRIDGWEVRTTDFDWVSPKGFLSGIGAALAGSMANKSNIVIDLRGWRTPSVSGEELQALGKSGPRYTAEITRGLPVQRG